MHSGRRISIMAGALGLALVLGNTGLSRPVRAQTSGVTIMEYSFNPSSLTVPAGSTVTWTNQGTRPHTVTDDSGAFSSAALNPGESYSYTFSQAGTFTYHCAIHTYMHGIIVVQGTAGTNTPMPTQTPTSIPVVTPATVPPPAPTAAPTDTPTSPPTSTPVPIKSAGTGSKRKIVLASKKNNRYVFAPVKTTVSVGTRVIWKNASDAPHTVTSRDRAWKLNRFLGAGASVSVLFKKPGTYRYYCRFHPGMRGSITVKR